jgi:hypothetical protein
MVAAAMSLELNASNLRRVVWLWSGWL